ncbi:MAG: hypothetical protein JNL09_10420, partial [Anaerolineales bacterium]|nr:hypothetical protein [Anaerolineales bacterium]
MNPQLVATSTNSKTTGLQLRGPVLALARFVWAALFVLALAVFGLSLYTYYSGHSSLACVNRPNPEFTPACLNFQAAIREWGFSVDGYAGYFLVVQLVTGIPYFVVGGLMAWRRSAELRVLLFSVWLVALAAAGTWFNPIWE